MDKDEVQSEQPKDADVATSTVSKSRGAQTTIDKQFDVQIAAMQDMLKDMAVEVEAAERNVEEKAGQTDHKNGPSQQPQSSQNSVSDVLQDMAAVEKVVGDYEMQLDSFLSRLDEMLDSDKHVKSES
ncbi:hypothetical protein COEREDRAFT_10569 [Coemansia reversa NRRL 1564]|uniref:Uncharacterized protein n=1 Tax=Coemansia reversa (strain ATCC 12441 / NRRL 1564) TaxID=763665 RepID=A0A2G5B5E0_COERN|nr:hypothetical protein COEREDRAFT_10569 [Coemansia reversa NRRL 1564]|eukprot:PIA14210.1 hypothetical protein COEREDRAFT_10569 [Coemansia reversa NRRL 1564]